MSSPSAVPYADRLAQDEVVTHRIDIGDHVRKWGLPEDESGRRAALDWAYLLLTDAHYAHAFMMAFAINGITGVLLVVSTPESVRMQQDNVWQLSQGYLVSAVYWLGMMVYWYPGLVPMNFAGITDSKYQGQMIAENMGNFFDQYLASSMPLWRNEYCIVRNGVDILDGFQRLISDKYHVESFLYITSGYSWYAYHGLDIHLRWVTKGMPLPNEEAHFLGNVSQWPTERRCIKPEDWYFVQDLLSMGQRFVITKWTAEYALMTSMTPGYASRLEGALRMHAQLFGIPVHTMSYDTILQRMKEMAKQDAIKAGKNPTDEQVLDWAIRITENHEQSRKRMTPALTDKLRSRM